MATGSSPDDNDRTPLLDSVCGTPGSQPSERCRRFHPEHGLCWVEWGRRGHTLIQSFTIGPRSVQPTMYPLGDVVVAGSHREAPGLFSPGSVPIAPEQISEGDAG
jgi:hypothetical protein